MEQNNGGKAACEVTTADHSEPKLPGKLETKPKPEIRQHLVTTPLDPNQPSEISQEPFHFLPLYAILKAELQQIQMLLLTRALKETSRGPQTQIPRNHNKLLLPEANPLQSTRTACLNVCQILSRTQVKLHI